MIKAIFFDLDGTLMDSEMYYLNGTAAWLKSLNIQFDERELTKIVGLTMDDTYKFLSKISGLSYKVSDYSRGVRADHVREPLRSEIEALGSIGERRNDGSCHNTLGQCAEQHAASTLQNRKYSSTPPAHLQFSKAMRPRTMEIVEYCKNCKDIFNL